MSKSPTRYTGDANRFAALEKLESRGAVNLYDLAAAWDKTEQAVRDWIKRFVPLGLVTADRTVRPVVYAVVPDWRERFARYIETRNEKLRSLGHLAFHGTPAPPQPPIPSPWRHKPDPALLVAARAVRPDVHTTWRLPETQARAAA